MVTVLPAPSGMRSYGTIESLPRARITGRFNRKVVVSLVLSAIGVAAVIAVVMSGTSEDDVALLQKQQLDAMTGEQVNAAKNADADLSKGPKMTKELKEVVSKVKKEWAAYTDKEATDTLAAAKKQYAEDMAAAKKADSAAREKLGYKAPAYAEIPGYGGDDATQTPAGTTPAAAAASP